MSREECIKIRTTTVAKQRWRSAAVKADMKLSEWVRAACRSYSRGGDDAGVQSELIRMRKEINRLGSNLNQITRLAHEGRVDAAAIEEAVAAIAAMKGVVVEALRR